MKWLSFGWNEISKTLKFSGIPSNLEHLWQVENVEEFKFYCCPECVYKSKEELIFQYHLNEKHFSKSSSKLFLSNEDVIKSENEYENEHENEIGDENSLPIDVTIHVKDEPIEIEGNDDNYSEEICENEAVKSERTNYKRKSKQQNQSYNEDYDMVDSKDKTKGGKITEGISIAVRSSKKLTKKLTSNLLI